MQIIKRNKNLIEGKLLELTDEELNELEVEVPFSRVLNETDRQLPYRRLQGYMKLTLHHGQRKLLLSEIEFLTEYSNLSKYIIYAGAAPGIHIVYLSRLFPRHIFYLFDPSEFKIKETNNIKIYKRLFTNEIAKSLERKFKGNMLFISDIRRGPEDSLILEDLNMQKDWVNIMKPKMNLLKFRLPYDINELEYFDGKVMYQVWAPLSSTETRLITDGLSNKIYNNPDYESIMYRFNNITRHQIFKHSITQNQVVGIDYCYDCYAEISILINYINKYKIKKNIYELMNDITKQCKQPLNRMCHGLKLEGQLLERQMDIINGNY